MRKFETGGFQVEMLPGLPGMSSLEIRQFARRGQSTHSEGAVLKINGPTKRWIGNFQSGRYYKGLTDVFPFQTQPSVCVVAGGQGYKLRLDSPDVCEVLQIFPALGGRHLGQQDWV